MSSNTIRVGRGGAGNFASQPSGAASSAATQEQLIASKIATPHASTTKATGRGGAGNFSTNSALAGEPSVQKNASGSGQYSRSSGRGGAGNFSSSNTSAAENDAEKQRADEIEKQVIIQVDQGLKIPAPAHSRVRSEKD